MLESLQIRNYALIENLKLDFVPGLNIFSGETGAGKSIIIGALSLVLGARSDSDLIRTGSSETVVTAVVRVPNDSPVIPWLSEQGLDSEDDQLILKRVVRANGRSSAFIQSEPVTVKDLQRIANTLFEIHGQHEHQALTDRKNQRILLDAYGGIENLVNEYREKHKVLSDLLDKVENHRLNEREMNREKDFLEYAINEIDQAEIRIGEDEELQEELNILNKAEQLEEELGEAIGQLGGEKAGLGQSILSLLKRTSQLISSSSEVDPALQEMCGRIESATLEIEDVYEGIRSYRESLEFSPGRIDEIHERTHLLNNLKRKYGDTLEDILSYQSQAQVKLQVLENSYSESGINQEAVRQYEIELSGLAERITAQRSKTGKELSPRIKRHLEKLGMPKAEFTVSVNPAEIVGSLSKLPSTGIDEIEFLISPNIGETLKPIRGIASGGELSRIMLALKTEFSENDKIETMIFDEIDSGIGGTVAVAVGRHLKQLSTSRQVLCITHLASIAAQADAHFSVRKAEEGERTFTKVFMLDMEQRVSEVARMLSGDAAGESAVIHARKLLQIH